MELIYSPNGNFGLDASRSPCPDPRRSRGRTHPGTPHYEGLNELQLFPVSPLASATTKSSSPATAASVVRRPWPTRWNPLGMRSSPHGQDHANVPGRRGRRRSSGAVHADDTASTAQHLGNLTSAGLVRVPGAIGIDPFDTPINSSNPGNQVDMYHFTVTGPGVTRLVAEVFAGRIGSPLDPASASSARSHRSRLQFVAGNNNTDNPVGARPRLFAAAVHRLRPVREPDGRRLLPRRRRRLQHAVAAGGPAARRPGALRPQRPDTAPRMAGAQALTS